MEKNIRFWKSCYIFMDDVKKYMDTVFSKTAGEISNKEISDLQKYIDNGLKVVFNNVYEMDKNLDNISLDELISLRNEVKNISDTHAKELTDFSVMYGDPSNIDVSKDMKNDYDKLNKFTNFLNLLNHKIENKIYEQYIQKD